MAKASKIISMAAVLLLVVLVLPFPPANVAANSYPSDVWVAPPPTGNNGNPGTQAQPFATIQYGIQHVAFDGTVHVAAGTYNEKLSISGATNLTGAGAQNTIIDGGGTGAVIYISSGPVTNMISGFTIQNGAPFGSDPGGGIYIGGKHIVTINDCTIKDNQADLGGGIYNRGQLYINRCAVSGNTATYEGGGIYNQLGDFLGSGNMWLTNCTISGNSVTDTNGMGAGIYNAYDMTLLNVTVANNIATGSASRGGGFANMQGNLTAFFKNCIVANNTAGTANTNNGYTENPEDTISQGHNLDSENSCYFNKSSDIINKNPLLGPLQDNDGPTFTHALLVGSPAIDAGDDSGAPTTDQRGIERPQGPSVDIGAYELVQTVVPTLPELPRYSPPMPNWTRLNPATISVQFVSVNPQQATANEPVTISTNVVNTGDESGNYNVALKINGQVEQTRMVGVGPQATQPIKFTVTKDQPGTYSVDIDGQKGSFTIPDTGGTARAPASGGLIAFLIIGVLILTAVMALVLSRRTA